MSSKPLVASYCTTFLKPEMLHIYRQVTGLQRYSTFVITRERQCADRYPFEDIELAQKRKLRKNFIRRFWLKHVLKLPALYYRGEMSGLVKILDRREADLMHIYFGHTGVHLLPFIQGWNKPCVVSFHGADVMPREERPEYEAKLRELLQVIPLVLARSRSLCDRLLALGCPEGKIRLNRTGIPLGEYPFVQRTAPADGGLQFVQACRLIPKKGLRTALRAFARFHAQHANSRFVIAGEGPMEQELKALADELDIARAVVFRGFLGQKELYSLYAKSHVFVHPSELTSDQNQEGIPNSMLEAMATGLPVLATLHGGIPEAVENGRNGLLVPERDHDGLYDAMVRIASEQGLASRLGNEASESVRREFEQARQIERLEGYYDEARALGVKPSAGAVSRPAKAHLKAEVSSIQVPHVGTPTFAYLFERYPSFVQTFCIREVQEMRAQGMAPMIFSIREAQTKEGESFSPAVMEGVQYLPADEELTRQLRSLREAKQVPNRIWDVFRYWGDKGDKTRLYEAHYIGRILKAKGICHVHTHFAGMGARTAYWIKKFFGITYSFTAHANDVFCENEHPVSLSELIREAAFVVTVSDFSARWIGEHFPESGKKVRRVYNGIHAAGYYHGEQEAPPLLASVGRLIEKKGFGDLILACRVLRERKIPFHCVIAGAGPLEDELRTQIQAENLDPYVNLAGPLTEAEVTELLSHSTLFVLACTRESDGGMDNLPTVIMEAMAAGLPVISTPIAGVPEMIIDGGTGYLVPDRSPEALAKAIERVLADPDRARQMGEAGRNLVAERFDTAITTRQLKHLLVKEGRAGISQAWKTDRKLILTRLGRLF